MDALKVISVGLHRTGSLSVKVALERLGFGPCYHGYDFVGRGIEDVEFWRKATDRGGDVDWDELFGQYQSATDWPMVFFWDKVVAAYPDAKVLLTERDPESWFESHLALFRMIVEVEQKEGPPLGAPILFELLSAMFGESLFDELFDRAHCIQVFNNHYARVRDEVPPERLLVYRVAEGWDPLCEFLEVPRPDEPFPRVNTREMTPANAARARSGVQPTSEWR